MIPIVMVPLSTAYARVPRTLRGLIQQGITLRHSLIENIAAGKWPRGIDGWRLKRRMRRAEVVFMDWENKPIDRFTWHSLAQSLTDANMAISSVWHSDAKHHEILETYHPPLPAYTQQTTSVSCHLDIRGRGAGTPRPDDDRPWTPELVAHFVRGRIRRGIEATGVAQVWAFCGVKHTHADAPNLLTDGTGGKFIPIDLWLTLVRTAVSDPRCSGLLIFGQGPVLRTYLTAHAQQIKEALA